MGTPAQPITINFEGVNHQFPADFSQQEIQRALTSYKNTQASKSGNFGPNVGQDYNASSSTPLNTSQVPVKPWVSLPGPGRQLDPDPRGIQGLGSAVADSMPAIGGAIATPESFGGLTIPGIAAGSAIKRGLKEVLPSVFGQNEPQGNDLVDTGGDVAANLLPYGVSKAVSGIANVVGQGGKQTVARMLANPFIGRNTAPVQEAVGQDIGNTVKAFTGDSFSELTSPRLEATRNLFKKGFSPSTGRIDSDAILDEMKLNGDKYKAIPADIQGNIQDFLEQAKSMQGDQSSSGHLLSMVKNKPVLAIPGMMAGSAVGGMAGHGFVGATVGAGAGIILGEQAISKLMANPEIAKLTIQAMKTPATAQESSIISKVILNSLRGTEVLVTNEEGKPEKAVVNEKGQVTYPRGQ